MVRLVVVDRTAESRQRLAAEVQRLLGEDLRDIGLLPRVNVGVLSPNEVRFHASPDICLVGPEVLDGDYACLVDIREALPATPLLARLPAKPGLAEIERLARIGIDDVLAGEISSAHLLERIVLRLSKRSERQRGLLILVEGGKGGVGVTTVAAGLGACLADNGRKTVLFDFDVETQDLARYLFVRPFINQNLRALFERQRPITEEFVRECAAPVWGEETGLQCIAPLEESEELYASRSEYSRILVSLLDVLDQLFDAIVVDAGAARGEILKVLRRSADRLVFVVERSPAAIFGSVERLKRLRSEMSPGAILTVLENSIADDAVPRDFFRREFERAAGIDSECWAADVVPFSRRGGRWPGSGETLYSCGRGRSNQAFQSLACRLGAIDPPLHRVAGRIPAAVKIGSAAMARLAAQVRKRCSLGKRLTRGRRAPEGPLLLDAATAERLGGRLLPEGDIPEMRSLFSELAVR